MSQEHPQLLDRPAGQDPLAGERVAGRLIPGEWRQLEGRQAGGAACFMAARSARMSANSVRMTSATADRTSCQKTESTEGASALIVRSPPGFFAGRPPPRHDERGGRPRAAAPAGERSSSGAPRAEARNDEGRLAVARRVRAADAESAQRPRRSPGNCRSARSIRSRERPRIGSPRRNLTTVRSSTSAVSASRRRSCASSCRSSRSSMLFASWTGRRRSNETAGQLVSCPDRQAERSRDR
jgi:hypothetical protein